MHGRSIETHLLIGDWKWTEFEKFISDDKAAPTFCWTGFLIALPHHLNHQIILKEIPKQRVDALNTELQNLSFYNCQAYPPYFLAKKHFTESNTKVVFSVIPCWVNQTWAPFQSRLWSYCTCWVPGNWLLQVAGPVEKNKHRFRVLETVYQAISSNIKQYQAVSKNIKQYQVFILRTC